MELLRNIRKMAETVVSDLTYLQDQVKAKNLTHQDPRVVEIAIRAFSLFTMAVSAFFFQRRASQLTLSPLSLSRMIPVCLDVVIALMGHDLFQATLSLRGGRYLSTEAFLAPIWRVIRSEG